MANSMKKNKVLKMAWKKCKIRHFHTKSRTSVLRSKMQKSEIFVLKVIWKEGFCPWLWVIRVSCQKSKLTNNFERKGLIQFWLCGDLTFKSSCISGRHVFQFERPLAMPGGNQLVAVIVDETVPSNEKHVWVSIANPRNLKRQWNFFFLSFSSKKKVEI